MKGNDQIGELFANCKKNEIEGCGGKRTVIGSESE